MGRQSTDDQGSDTKLTMVEEQIMEADEERSSDSYMGAVIYNTWQTRNWKIFRNTKVNTEFATAQIKKELKHKLKDIQTCRKAHKCRQLLHRLCN